MPSTAPPPALNTLELLQQELEATSREVLLLTLELEQRVAERTAELAQSNQRLLKEVAERIRAEAEVKKLNADLSRRADLLQAANEELEAFSSSVSHDLRNPLAKITGIVSLLQQKPAVSSADLKRFLQQIETAARDMATLIDGLLRLSFSSQAELHLTQVNLNRLLDHVIHDITAASPGADIRWSRAALPEVLGDYALLNQVFVNLLNNAVKYSRGRHPVQIEIGVLENPHSEQWEIFVRDNGVGFDSARADKLFCAFQRFHSRDQFEGTGIGLATVRRIILRHGGRVWASSRPGQGATFFVAIPK